MTPTPAVAPARDAEIDANPARDADPAAPEDAAFEAALSDARAEGANEAARVYERRLQEERQDALSARALARDSWAQEEGSRLAEDLRAGFLLLEESVAECLSNFMQAFLEATARERAFDELASTVRAIVRGGAPRLAVHGSADLLRSARSRLDMIATPVEFIDDGEPGVRVVAHKTEIETRLSAWRDSFKRASE